MTEPIIDVIQSENWGPDKRFEKLPYKDILLQSPFTMGILGGIGAGKTSFAYTLINKLYKNYFDELIVICGTIDSKDAWEKVNQRNVLFVDAFDDDIVWDYVKQIEKDKEERRAKGKYPLRCCILMDDMVFDGYSKNRAVTLERLIRTCRHYNISLILLIQNTKMISSDMRGQIFQWFVFRLSELDLEKFAEEHANSLNIKQFKNMYNDIQKQGKHEFLLVDYKKDFENRFSHRFTTPIDISKYKV